jgi:hypothetical protein
VFGTVLYVEECVRYSIVGRRMCSVQCCMWKSVFGTVLYVEECVRYSGVGGRVCSKTSFTVGKYTLYHSCTYYCLPDDEPSCWKQLEDIEKLIF